MNNNQKLELIQNSKLIVGIDIAKNTHVATFLNPSGKELRIGLKIQNNKNGFQMLEEALQPYDPKSVVISMEPTGHYYKSLAHAFYKKGYVITLVNPYHTKLSKEIGTNDRSKSDVKDSKLIARLTREGKFCKSLLLTGQYSELRKVTLLHRTQIQERTRAIIRLRTLLDEYLPEYDGIFSDIIGATSFRLLQTYGLVDLRSDKYFDEKIKLIVNTSRGQIVKERAGHIIKTLVDSIGVVDGLNMAQVELVFLLQQIEFLQNTLKITAALVTELLKGIPEAKYFLEINGVGPIIAGTILGQTGEFTRYTNVKQLEKLAGLTLVENESGQFRGRRKINKRGRDTLRHALYCLSISLILNHKEFKQYYNYKVKTLKKPKMIAIIALQTKFLKTIFAAIKNKEKYNDELVIVGISQN